MPLSPEHRKQLIAAVRRLDDLQKRREAVLAPLDREEREINAEIDRLMVTMPPKEPSVVGDVIAAAADLTPMLLTGMALAQSAQAAARAAQAKPQTAVGALDPNLSKSARSKAVVRVVLKDSPPMRTSAILDIAKDIGPEDLVATNYYTAINDMFQDGELFADPHASRMAREYRLAPPKEGSKKTG